MTIHWHYELEEWIVQHLILLHIGPAGKINGRGCYVTWLKRFILYGYCLDNVYYIYIRYNSSTKQNHQFIFNIFFCSKNHLFIAFYCFYSGYCLILTELSPIFHGFFFYLQTNDRPPTSIHIIVTYRKYGNFGLVFPANFRRNHM
jgi:hypothetical protein